MDQQDIVNRFNSLVALDDSLLQTVRLQTGKAECGLEFDFARLLAGEGANIFSPEAVYRPALLTFHGIRSIYCEGATYQLNSTVVGFGAELSTIDGYCEFYFELTGGTDPDAFMAKVKIIAKDYSFGPSEDGILPKSSG
jgi:hypothetical protein